MRVWCRAYWAPKESCSEEEYEDTFAWWPRRRHLEGVSGSRFSFAVADGATASAGARRWARQLALGFVTGRLHADNLAEELPALSKRWTHKAPKRPLRWWAEQSLERGAYAALVGLVVHDDVDEAGTRSWKAMAVGDSCLIHMRDGRLEASFPLDRADQFGSSPVLLSTNVSATEAALTARKTIEGWGTADEQFYLMTDALAQWFLDEVERGGKPWEPLQDFDNDPAAPEFREWLAGLRRAGRIRNDDVTLLRVIVSR